MKASVLNLYGNTLFVEDGSWAEILARLSSIGTFKQKKLMPLLKLAEFNGPRCDANMTILHGIEGDYDGGLITMQAALDKLEASGIRASIYETPSSTPSAPRWRVVCPASRPLHPSQHRLMVERLNGALGGILAGESFTLSQSYFFGQLEGGPKFEMLHTFDDPSDGTCIDQMDNLDEAAIGKETAGRSSSGGFEFSRENLMTGDGRREILKSLIGVLCNECDDEAGVLKGVQAFVAEQFNPTDAVDWQNIKKIIRHLWNKGGGDPHQSSSPPPPLVGQRGSDLMAKYLPPLFTLSGPFVFEGHTLFAGAPKLGKTTLARSLLGSVSSGKPFMGNGCLQGEALFLSLEGGERETQRKLRSQGWTAQDLANLEIFYQWPRGKEAVDRLHDHLSKHPKSFMLIDGFSSIAGNLKQGRQSVEEHKEGMMWQKLAEAHQGLCSWMIAHTRNVTAYDSDDNILERVGGTNGVIGSPDCIIVMLKQDGRYRLHIQGRNWDQPENDFELDRAEDQHWSITGAWEAQLSDDATAQKKVIDILAREGAVSTGGLAQRTGVTRQTMERTCGKLKKAWRVEKEGEGWVLI